MVDTIHLEVSPSPALSRSSCVSLFKPLLLAAGSMAPKLQIEDPFGRSLLDLHGALANS